MSSSFELQKAYDKLADTILDEYTNPSQWFVGVTPNIHSSFARLRMARNKYAFIELNNEEDAMMLAELLITNLGLSRSSVKYSGNSTFVYVYLLGEGDESYEQKAER